MPAPTDDTDVSRRGLLRLLGVAGLVGAAAPLSACSASAREDLLEVDPRQVRIDRGGSDPGPGPGPSDRELRRRAVAAGSVAALGAWADAGDALPALRGCTGGVADPVAALAVHQAHVDLLGDLPGTTAPLVGSPLPPPAVDVPGPVLAPADRPRAVLLAGTATAVRACGDELAADDADLPLVQLYARIAAARAAQARALAPAGSPAPLEGLRWPTTAVGGPVVQALQDLLATEHRARWSYGVVLAWAGERQHDAEAARRDHTARTEQLLELVELQGAEPVRARATYPTDDAGRPVDGPDAAAALALRLEEAVTLATEAVLSAAVAEGSLPWTTAAVAALAESERCRWSWGGLPVALPGT